MRAESVTRLSVTDFFNADASNWDSIYERSDVFSVIHQLRRDMCLSWVKQALPEGRILDVGCGAGLVATSLAQLGYRVTATDNAMAMLKRTRERAEAAGVALSLRLAFADANRLPFPDHSFDLVIALGLVPWLENPEDALAEMARVVAPGGAVLVSCDNRNRLAVLVDPRFSPATARLRTAFRQSARAARATPAWAEAMRHTTHEFDARLRQAGLEPERGATFGYGPFTLLGRELLGRRLGLAAHRLLQRLGDAGFPVLRSTGAQYLVLARRPT